MKFISNKNTYEFDSISFEDHLIALYIEDHLIALYIEDQYCGGFYEE